MRCNVDVMFAKPFLKESHIYIRMIHLSRITGPLSTFRDVKSSLLPLPTASIGLACAKIVQQQSYDVLRKKGRTFGGACCILVRVDIVQKTLLVELDWCENFGCRVVRVSGPLHPDCLVPLPAREQGKIQFGPSHEAQSLTPPDTDTPSQTEIKLVIGCCQFDLNSVKNQRILNEQHLHFGVYKRSGQRNDIRPLQPLLKQSAVPASNLKRTKTNAQGRSSKKTRFCIQ